MQHDYGIKENQETNGGETCCSSRIKQIVEHMVQTDKSCEDVAKFSYHSDTQMDKFEDMVMQIENVLDKQEANSSQKGIKKETDELQKAKLPKLQINKYGGDALKWIEFWEQFGNAIHTRKVEGTTKFSYLRELLVGKAAAVIRGLPLTSKNYDVALERLKKESGDDSRLRSAHIKAIRDIQPGSECT